MWKKIKQLPMFESKYHYHLSLLYEHGFESVMGVTKMQNVGEFKCIHVRCNGLKTGQITEYTLSSVASSNIVVQTSAATVIVSA
jgi:hypothetical protein